MNASVLTDPTVTPGANANGGADPKSAADSRITELRTRIDEIDDMIEAQRRAINPRERARILADIQKKVAADVPFVPLFNPVYVTAYHKSQKGHALNTAHWMTRFEFVKIERN